MTFLGFRLEKSLREELENNDENELTRAESVTEFIDSMKEHRYDCILIDETNLPTETLINLIKKAGEFQPKIIVLIIGQSSNLKVVAGSIKAGAYDYLLKPVLPAEVVKTAEKAVKDYKLMAERVEKGKNIGDKLIGQTKEIVKVYKKIGKMAATRMPVLVSGEKGTGKKSVALAIHQFGDTAKKPFISINCSSFPQSLLERRLFGYEKGAFEGAIFSQAGELEKASGGTLHLGNIEHLSLEVQSKLLYFLQEGEFFRMGGVDPIKTDMRIITTTSVDLSTLVSKQKFIEELYDMLKILEISLPALRNRKDDIPFIIDNYLIECNREFNKAVKGISKPAMKKILRHEWEGNINELKNAIKSAVAMCRGTSILVEDLPENVTGAKPKVRNSDNQHWVMMEWIEEELKECTKNSKKGKYYTNIMNQVEKELLKRVLVITNGKKLEAAEVLGITRNTLRTKMTNYGLD